MRHAAHVGAVDAHAERIGRDHHLQLARHEGALHPVALLAGHAGVVRLDGPAVPREPLRLFLRAAPRRCVYDGRAAAGTRAAQGLDQHPVEAPVPLPFGQYLRRAERQVGAREAVDHLRRVGGQAETFQDLVPHHRRGGCRAGQHAGPRQQPQQLLELQVVGSEIVPPGADAVRLVDCHQRAVDALQGSPQPGVGQALGGHVDQLEGAARERGNPSPHLVEGQGAGQVGGGDAALLQRRHLVVHQGDQRRDHHGGAGQQRRRELVGQALAAAGRGHQQQPPRLQQGLDGLSLPGAEAAQPEPSQSSIQVQPGAP